MRRTISAVVLAVAGSMGVAGVVAAAPVTEPASCAGYLAAWANPNNGWIIQNLVRPLADDLGATVGDLTKATAFEHEGGIEACIP